jgi:hypothetical protein
MYPSKQPTVAPFTISLLALASTKLKVNKPNVICRAQIQQSTTIIALTYPD